ncbi:zinc ribbon domain-containing protein [Myxococcota bacterium]|nr:zinc ribbon domain-containing protein [Myxococcota bacterium]
MICPHCGDAVDDRWELCPACGNYIHFDPNAEQTGENEIPNYGGGGNATSIVAVDPEFQKSTRIVSNPLLESSTRKRVKEPKPAALEEPSGDDISNLTRNFWYVHGRLNFLEKGAFWLLVATIFFCFTPWYHDLKNDVWVSGYETDGLWVALMGTFSALFLLIRIGMRLGLWAQLLHLVLLFGAAALCVYLLVVGNPPERAFMPFFHGSLFLGGGALLLGFLGAMRRFLS